MSGIYIHIPFCKQACHYCNFHFSTSVKYKGEMVAAIIKEIGHRHGELLDEHLTSIYFGGGTPSLLSSQELGDIFEALAKYYCWDEDTEITLEANPDDLNKEKLQDLKRAGINRLSIGIQSFDEQDLKYMNRAHNAQEAARCIDLAQECGYENITADLIYGSPTTSDETWLSNIEKLLSYDLPHISAYCLTVEEGTALHHFVKSGKSAPVDSVKALRHFELLVDRLCALDYDHYEISNFAKPDKYAIHNTSYWQGKPYLGIGPAAHSYDGHTVRRWNIAHNAKYLSALKDDLPFWDTETLTTTDRYNEYILVRLRTKWGIDTDYLSSTYTDIWKTTNIICEKLITESLLYKDRNTVKLTNKGKFLADNVSMQLFWE